MHAKQKAEMIRRESHLASGCKQTHDAPELGLMGSSLREKG